MDLCLLPLLSPLGPTQVITASKRRHRDTASGWAIGHAGHRPSAWSSATRIEAWPGSPEATGRHLAYLGSASRDPAALALMASWPPFIFTY